jgi:hypothetical protein
MLMDVDGGRDSAHGETAALIFSTESATIKCKNGFVQATSVDFTTNIR